MSMLVQGVHVKNRCAFLNHSSTAMEFMQLVEQYPNIALWFSVSRLSQDPPQQCSSQPQAAGPPVHLPFPLLN